LDATQDSLTARDALMRRWIERMTAMILGVGLIVFAIGQLPAPSERTTNSQEGNATKLEVSFDKSGPRISVENYGPSVALAVLAIALVAITFFRPLKLPNSIMYLEPQGEGQVLPLLNRDDLKDLRLAAEELIRTRPDSDAAIRVQRVYEMVFQRGHRTAIEQARFDELPNKLKAGSLSGSEQSELNALRERYLAEDKPPWL